MHIPTVINILITVVDNYGDMGTAWEYMEAYERYVQCPMQWHIWTNDRVQVQWFFAAVFPSLQVYVRSMDRFEVDASSPVTMSFLHAPRGMYPRAFSRSLSLHIDYLSFDPIWIQCSGCEHVTSSWSHQQIVLIPSPLPGGAGLILPRDTVPYSREYILQSLSVIAATEAPWMVIFSYPETLACIDWESFPPDMVFFVLGGVKVSVMHPGIRCFPLLKKDDYYGLLRCADLAIIRGDTSLAQALQMQTPFYADIYKDIGGYPEVHVDQLLAYMWATSQYAHMHHAINRERTPIEYATLCSGLTGMRFWNVSVSNLCEEVQKHIDRFYFSL